jgi:intracellular septation protein
MNTNLVWFGFLPIVAYLLLDSFAGKRQALWGALSLGAGEAIYSVVQFGALDYMSIVTFLILAGFVALSLRTQDDFYFKIHGALINILLAFFMLGAWYIFHKALLLDMANKYVGLDKLVAYNPALDKETLAETFRVLSYQLPAWLIFHSLITIYAAANWGKWVWASIRVPGFIFTLILASGFAQAAVIQGPK